MAIVDITDMIYSDLLYCLNREQIIRDEPMSRHTSFKIGGPADIYVSPKNKNQLIDILNILAIHNYPYIVIGKGTDILVKDGGIRGAVIDTTCLNKINVDSDSIIAEPGVSIKDLCNTALANSLTGIEFACGIPGTVGGAIYMNAGAYGGEIKDVLDWCIVIDTKNIKQYKLDNKEMDFGYRTTIVQKKNLIVLEACFKLKKGENEAIRCQMDELNRRRTEKQPLDFPSAGSVFKRPQGYYAGKLIEDAGLKGVRIGDAQVSEKHTGFIINCGNASASDVLSLIGLIQKTVKEKFGVDMYPEIKIIGEEKQVD